jgi:hypothetical protein
MDAADRAVHHVHLPRQAQVTNLDEMGRVTHPSSPPFSRPTGTRRGRYQPPDRLLALLQRL